MRRTGSFLPPTLALLSGVAACTGTATREACPPQAPCPPPAAAPPLASCPPASAAPAAEAPPHLAAPAPPPPSPGEASTWRTAVIVTLPSEGKLVIDLAGDPTSEEGWGCHPPPGKVEVAQAPGRIGLRLLPPRLGGHGGLCRARVQFGGQATVGPLAGGEWVLDPRGGTVRRVRFEGSDGRSIELR